MSRSNAACPRFQTPFCDLNTASQSLSDTFPTLGGVFCTSDCALNTRVISHSAPLSSVQILSHLPLLVPAAVLLDVAHLDAWLMTNFVALSTPSELLLDVLSSPVCFLSIHLSLAQLLVHSFDTEVVCLKCAFASDVDSWLSLEQQHCGCFVTDSGKRWMARCDAV